MKRAFGLLDSIRTSLIRSFSSIRSIRMISTSLIAFVRSASFLFIAFLRQPLESSESSPLAAVALLTSAVAVCGGCAPGKSYTCTGTCDAV